MELNLDTRLNEEEQEELKRRVYSIMEQMYMEGITAGRELSRENLHPDTERYIQDKISFMTNYFVMEQIWQGQPPSGYNPKREIPKFEKDSDVKNDYQTMVKKMESGDTSKEINPNTEMDGKKADQKPDWAKEEEKPEWASARRPFK